MQCERPSQVHGACWLDENTFIATFANSRQVWKYAVNRPNSCSGELLDSGYTAYDASCTTDGKVYVTELKASDFVKVRIYDIQKRNTQEWNPPIPTIKGIVRIAINDNFIVINSDSDVYNYVFNKDRIFQFKFSLSLPHYERFLATIITQNDIFWGVTNPGRQLLIWNMRTNQTQLSPSGMNVHSVACTREGSIFSYRLNGISFHVYSPGGRLLHSIPIQSKHKSLGWGAAVVNSDKQDLLAYDTFGSVARIFIFALYP